MARFNNGSLVQSPDMFWLLHLLDAPIGCAINLEVAYTVYRTQDEAILMRIENTCSRKWRQ